MKSTFWLFTHNFTNTGAPLVLADLARELAEVGFRARIRFVSWGGEHDRRYSTLQNDLVNEGFECDILDFNSSLPRPRKCDRVLLNSLALPEAVILKALDWLEGCQISRLDWFAHEGNPGVWLPDKVWPTRIRTALQCFGLQLRVPSSSVLNTYQEWLQYTGPALQVQLPSFKLSAENQQLFANSLPTFESLRLQITAMAGSGQKGHLWLLNFIRSGLHDDQNTDPSLRPIELYFIGLEAGPYAAFTREICRQGVELLGDQFHWTEHSARSDALAVMRQANIAVSCSLAETFSLVSLEAMALGQPLLRNRTGGCSEQLQNNINGFDLGVPSPRVTPQQIQLLRRLRDPRQISEETLTRMAVSARETAKRFTNVKYSDWLLVD